MRQWQGLTDGPAEGGPALPSTAVRVSLDAGDVEQAARALGRDYRLEGSVVPGDQRGRQLGYPTANVQPVASSAVPADGAYAGRLLLWTGPGGGTVTALPAAISIGTNPTFSGAERRVEVHVLDLAGGPPPHLDLYGEHVGVEFVARLRGIRRFSSVDELLQQLAIDVQRTRELLASRPL